MPVVRANKLWQQPVSPAQNSKPAPAGEAQVAVSALKPEPTVRTRLSAAMNVTVEHIVPPTLGLLGLEDTGFLPPAAPFVRHTKLRHAEHDG